MKSIVIGAMAASLAIGTAFAKDAAPAPAKPRQVCLQVSRIDNTHVVDKSTIIFRMTGGKLWKNDLRTPCSGLNFYGFAYVTRDGQICNTQPIMILRTHEVCMLGDFVPYTPPPKAKPDHHR